MTDSTKLLQQFQLQLGLLKQLVETLRKIDLRTKVILANTVARQRAFEEQLERTQE